MSFWNLLCEAALLDMVCKWFSPKHKTIVKSYQPHYSSPDNPGYEARIEELEQEIKESEKRIAEYQKIIDSSSSVDLEDIDDLQDRIYKLESQLDDYDVMSDRYDSIQDEIDLLQDRLEDMERLEYMNELDDMATDLDPFSVYL